MDFPNLKPGQIALFHAEVRTGIVTFPDGRRYLGIGDYWMIFDSLGEAKQYAQRKTTEIPEIECWLYDASNQPIERIWNEEYWNDQRTKIR
jgi:hypothetical protein